MCKSITSIYESNSRTEEKHCIFAERFQIIWVTSIRDFRRNSECKEYLNV